MRILKCLQIEEKFGVQGEVTDGMSVRHCSRGCGTLLASFESKKSKITDEPDMDFQEFSQLFDSDEDDDAHVRYLQYQLHAQRQQRSRLEYALAECDEQLLEFERQREQQSQVPSC